MRRRSGWVFIDVLTGIILVGALALILAAGASRQERGERHIANTRAAARLAESTLISLQALQQPALPRDARVVIRDLGPFADLPGMRWNEVRAEIGDQKVSIIGLVPKDAMEKAQ